MCKIALLIDGDNAQSKFIEHYIAEASRFGKVTVKRIYADWTKTELNGWKKVLNKNAVRAMQKFSYTSGKNSTDTALIIDAMDLVHFGKIEGVCIVSSDSDYTGLAHRIREEGLFIMGIGKSQTPEAFRNACEQFVFTEIFEEEFLKEKKSEVDIPVEVPKLEGPKVIGKIDLIEPLKKKKAKKIKMDIIRRAFESVADVNTGFAFLSRFSEAIRRIDSSFDHRNYGFKTFKDFCNNLSPEFELVLANDKSTYSIKKNN